MEKATYLERIEDKQEQMKIEKIVVDETEWKLGLIYRMKKKRRSRIEK